MRRETSLGSMRALLWGIAMGTTGLTAGGCGESSGPAIRNVLLITLDTTRADHLSCYGAAAGRTPHLDRLAREGVRFSDVTAAAPTTLASHSTLMTGTYPHTHGVARNGFVLDDENVTLAELLRSSGRRTLGVIGSFALERRFGLAQGFDVFDQELELRSSAGTVDQDQRRAERVTAAVLAGLDALGGDPWFCFAQYFDPHAPYAPPAPWDAAYTPDGAPHSSLPEQMEASALEHRARLFGPEQAQRSVIQTGFPADWIGRADPEPAANDAVLAGLYAGEVSYMDEAIGALLAGLEARGHARDTLVIVTADHGESFCEHHDYWNHGSWLYQSTVRVPLVLRFPDGRFAGREVGVPVSSTDILPTVCELLGLALPARCEGRSLLPALTSEHPFERGPIYSEATQPGVALERAGEWANRLKPRCVRSGRYKYLWSPYAGTEELFDLEQDPLERQNLLREPSPAIEELRASLELDLRRWSRSARPLPSVFEAGERDENLRRLGDLGYTEGQVEGGR